MEQDEWLVEGKIHDGAHLPLCVFTKNASARSQEAAERRAQTRSGKGGRISAKGKRAEAQEKGKGKLRSPKGKGQSEGSAPAQKGKPAVAEQEGREVRWAQMPMGKGAAAAQKGIPAVADHDPEPPWANYRTIEARRAESDAESDAWFDSYLDELQQEPRYADDYMGFI